MSTSGQVLLANGFTRTHEGPRERGPQCQHGTYVKLLLPKSGAGDLSVRLPVRRQVERLPLSRGGTHTDRGARHRHGGASWTAVVQICLDQPVDTAPAVVRKLTRLVRVAGAPARTVTRLVLARLLAGEPQNHAVCKCHCGTSS
jgi:hypothetical protein